MKTECYSYFEIRSAGYLDIEKGYIADPDSDFNPEHITEKLEITPHKVMKMGTTRENGIGKYPCSSWIFQPEPEADDPTQCISIVRALKEKIPLLQEIYKELNVIFGIQVKADVVAGETVPCFGFDDEIIEFCYLTETEIGLYFHTYTNE